MIIPIQTKPNVRKILPSDTLIILILNNVCNVIDRIIQRTDKITNRELGIQKNNNQHDETPEDQNNPTDNFSIYF